jgi:DNA-binding NarL/FixJ family response regulator
MPSAIRLLIVEDDSTVRNALKELAGEAGAFELVQTASTASEARELIRKHRFDIALLDLGLPDGSGVDVIVDLKRLQPEVSAVVFTIFDDAPNVLAAVRAGARGYLLKSTPPGLLITKLLEAAAGHSPMSSAAAKHLVDALAPPEADKVASLTAREKEVLGVLARGYSYQETARLLSIGLGTVQGHVKVIYEKLDVTTKAEAAAIAVRLGLI